VRYSERILAILRVGGLPQHLADEFAFVGPNERFELLIDLCVDGLSCRASTA